MGAIFKSQNHWATTVMLHKTVQTTPLENYATATMVDFFMYLLLLGIFFGLIWFCTYVYHISAYLCFENFLQEVFHDSKSWFSLTLKSWLKEKIGRNSYFHFHGFPPGDQSVRFSGFVKTKNHQTPENLRRNSIWIRQDIIGSQGVEFSKGNTSQWLLSATFGNCTTNGSWDWGNDPKISHRAVGTTNSHGKTWWDR